MSKRVFVVEKISRCGITLPMNASFEPHSSFSLGNFEGPLDFLLYLVQTREIDICEVSLREITQQLFAKFEEMRRSPQIDDGAEWVALTALLLWMKSKTLLPELPAPASPEEEVDPLQALVPQLMDYCRFKEAARHLSALEEGIKQYPRGDSSFPVPKASGVDHLTLHDLEALFLNLMEKTKGREKFIQEEPWHVGQKMEWLKHCLLESRRLAIELLLRADMSRQELIVTFLAILELMKEGGVQLVRSDQGLEVVGRQSS